MGSDEEEEERHKTTHSITSVHSEVEIIKVDTKIQLTTVNASEKGLDKKDEKNATKSKPFTKQDTKAIDPKDIPKDVKNEKTKTTIPDEKTHMTEESEHVN